jgi:hypothetical protein
MPDNQPGSASATNAARTAVLVIAVFVLIALVLALAGGFINLSGLGTRMPSPSDPITVP